MRDDYDYNIYAPSDWEVGIYAYKQYRRNRVVYTDNSEWYSLVFNLSENPEEVKYLLDSEIPEETFPDGFEDYDDWVGFDYLTEGKTPASILEWLGNLPEYDMKEVND